MTVDVHVSAMLRNRCGGRGNFTVEGASIRDLAEVINIEFPGFIDAILQPNGSTQKGVLVSINGEMVQSESCEEMAVKSGDKVYFLSTVAGG